MHYLLFIISMNIEYHLYDGILSLLYFPRRKLTISNKLLWSSLNISNNVFDNIIM